MSERRVPVLNEALLSGVRGVLGDSVVALYVYGAIAFNSSMEGLADLDFHALLNQPMTDQERPRIWALHQALESRFGIELDGWYVLLDEALRARHPATQLRPEFRDKSWALHRAHLRAGRCVVLFGPDPIDLLPEPTWSELAQALDAELEFVQRELAVNPAFCVLNLCRIVYSWTTRKVVLSKREAAEWFFETGSQEWHSLIRAATSDYGTKNRSPDLEGLLAQQTHGFYDHARAQIADIRS
jgi:hypothetical protein